MLPIFPVGYFSGSTLTAGMIVAYLHDEVGAGNRADSGPYGLTLTNVNAATSTAGKVNNATSLVRASSQYLHRPSSDAVLSPGNTDFSFIAWANHVSFPADECILSKYDLVPGTNGEYLLYAKAAGQVYVWQIIHTAATSYTLNSSLVLTTGRWYFIYVEFDSIASIATIKVRADNGVGYTTDTLGGVGFPQQKTDPFCIGAISDPGLFANAAVDIVLGWNRKLTTTEINLLYNAGNGLQPPFL